MLKESNFDIKKFTILFGITLFITILLAFCLPFSSVNAETAEGQEVEYRAVELKEVGNTTQLIVEVWIKKLSFQVIDIRVEHDNFILPSNITNNEIIDVNDVLLVPENFTFENGFGEFMSLTLLGKEESDESENNESEKEELRFVYSVIGEDEMIGQNEYLQKTDSGLYQVAIDEPVLIGKLSFQVGEGEITGNSIALKGGSTSPIYGIEVFVEEKDSGDTFIEDPDLFSFTLDLASDDAFLSNIVLSRGEINEENPDESTYKEYVLNPEFEKETLTYKVKISEYIDTLNITATQNHEKATMKIKVPKRNENNELVYDEDGNIIYEEKELIDKIPLEITLNKLGEGDTILTIEVTAEDKKTTETYSVVIERPYGTIKGSIQLGDGLRESMQNGYGVYTKYIADATVYKADLFDWKGIISKDTSYEELALLTPEISVTTNEDTGEYEIKIIPGTYDLQLARKGFLDRIVKNITVNEGDTIELSNKILTQGDVDRDGIIGLQDYTKILNRQDAREGDSMYSYEYDFGQKGFIALIDITTVVNYMDSLLTVENYEEM